MIKDAQRGHHLGVFGELLLTSQLVLGQEARRRHRRFSPLPQLFVVMGGLGDGREGGERAR